MLVIRVKPRMSEASLTNASFVLSLFGAGPHLGECIILLCKVLFTGWVYFGLVILTKKFLLVWEATCEYVAHEQKLHIINTAWCRLLQISNVCLRPSVLQNVSWMVPIK